MSIPEAPSCRVKKNLERVSIMDKSCVSKCIVNSSWFMFMSSTDSLILFEIDLHHILIEKPMQDSEFRDSQHIHVLNFEPLHSKELKILESN